MHLATDSSEIRSILDGVAAPAAIAKQFLTDSGELDVTGVLAEVRDGEYGTVYVTYSSKPFSTDARYEAVLLNGAWNLPDAAPAQEMSHG